MLPEKHLKVLDFRHEYVPRLLEKYVGIIDVLIGEADLNVNTQMVVQGWTLQNYLENIDRIKEEGLLTERLGIGSICRRAE